MSAPTSHGTQLLRSPLYPVSERVWVTRFTFWFLDTVPIEVSILNHHGSRRRGRKERRRRRKRKRE